jgi:hypothetical protein
MTSARRIRANRRNARKSTGPRSATGKSHSKMNALKHGLDAQTLILPGEDEAAFRARLDAWKAGVKPRNPLEESLIEQAARLSWQVERADRVQAAILTERIQLVQSEDGRRQREEAEAAEAAELGRRLLDGPPAPTFDLALLGDRLARLAASDLFGPVAPVGDPSRIAGKNLAMPMHPDDPEHPARLLRRLQSTAVGCRSLIDRWAELRAALEADAWQPPARLAAVRLLGQEPADAVDDPLVRSIYLCSFVLDSKGPGVFTDQVHEMTTREFAHFLERLAGRGVKEWVPSSREAARDGLLALINAVMVGLQTTAAAHAERSEARAASAADRLAFDDTSAGERLRRLQGRLNRSLIRTINALMKVRRAPDPRATPPECAPTVALTPGEPTRCAKLRNEPNLGSSDGSDAPGSDPVGWVQPTETRGLPPVDGIHQTISEGEGRPEDRPDRPPARPALPGMVDSNPPLAADQRGLAPGRAPAASNNLREDSDWHVRFDSEILYNHDPADAPRDGIRAISSGPSSRAGRTGSEPVEDAVMDTSELLSQFSINRLDGESVPDDVRILLPHRDELAGRSGVHLVSDEDWSPWLDTSGLAEAVRSDPDAAADLRARAEVCRLCAFVAVDRAGQYLGYWRGPSRRKIAQSPILVLGHPSQFHLCIAQTFAEAVLERAYGREGFQDLRDWFQSLGIAVGWESPSQLTLPYEKLPPKEMYRQLFDRYRGSLLSH